MCITPTWWQGLRSPGFFITHLSSRRPASQPLSLELCINCLLTRMSYGARWPSKRRGVKNANQSWQEPPENSPGSCNIRCGLLRFSWARGPEDEWILLKSVPDEKTESFHTFPDFTGKVCSRLAPVYITVPRGLSSSWVQATSSSRRLSAWCRVRLVASRGNLSGWNSGSVAY